MKIKNNNIVSTKTKVADGSVMSSLTSKVMGQFDIFKHLVSTVKELSELILLVQENKLQEIFNILTQEYFATLSEKLYRLKKNPNKYKEYEMFRNLINNTLYILFRTITISINNLNILNELEIYKDDSDILHDSDRLLEFINNLKHQVSLFGEELKLESTVEANVNPEYAEYFRLYGIPPDLIFVPKRLAEIKIRLNI